MKKNLIKLIKICFFLIISIHNSLVDAQENVYIMKWSPNLISMPEKDLNTRKNSCTMLNIEFKFKINYPKFGLNFKNFNDRIENLIKISKVNKCDGYDIHLNKYGIFFNFNKFQVCFDIAEVYARQFRQELFLHQGFLSKKFVATLLKKVSLKRDAQILLFYREACSDFNEVAYNKWRDKINKELDSLSDYSN